MPQHLWYSSADSAVNTPSAPSRWQEVLLFNSPTKLETCGKWSPVQFTTAFPTGLSVVRNLTAPRSIWKFQNPVRSLTSHVINDTVPNTEAICRRIIERMITFGKLQRNLGEWPVLRYYPSVPPERLNKILDVDNGFLFQIISEHLSNRHSSRKRYRLS